MLGSFYKSSYTRQSYNLLKQFSVQYDLCVVGGGPGGYVAAIKAGQLGLKTVVVEKRGSLGGTCLNVGCIPSKSLLNVSHKYHEMTNAKSMGINADNVSYDWAKILQEKGKIVTGLTKGIEGLLKKNKVDYKKGHGTIVGANQVSVNGTETLDVKNILIATGSEPTAFPGIPFDEKVFISSTGFLFSENKKNRCSRFRESSRNYDNYRCWSYRS